MLARDVNSAPAWALVRSPQGECSRAGAAAPRCFGVEGECREHLPRARHAVCVPDCHFLEMHNSLAGDSVASIGSS